MDDLLWLRPALARSVFNISENGRRLASTLYPVRLLAWLSALDGVLP
jgi:hypothetical protein